MTEVPLLDGGAVPRVAGWMDRDTVLAFVVGFAAGEAILSGRTWRVGDPSWKESIVDVQWPNDGSLDDSEMASVRADLSPDGTLLLLTRKITDTGTGVLEATQAALFDAQTGRPLGIPDAAGRFGAGARGHRPLPRVGRLGVPAGLAQRPAGHHRRPHPAGA